MAELRVVFAGLPPTANERLAAVGGKLVRRRGAGVGRFQAALGAAGLVARGRDQMLSGPLRVTVTFSLGPKRRRDVDAGIKDVLDGLTGIWWRDDRQVWEVTIRNEFVETDRQEATWVVASSGHVVSGEQRRYLRPLFCGACGASLGDPASEPCP